MDLKKKQYLNLTFFAVAFGFLEAVIVVYLRRLYYPEGFFFPLKWIPADIIYTEILREVSTMVMVYSVARLSFKKGYRALGAFLFIFGIWDIFYYISLKLLLGWPPSLFTWDILYLIPVTWAAPVIAPVICSLTMIGGAFLIEWAYKKNKDIKILTKEWVMIAAGAVIVFFTFIYDYGVLILKEGLFSKILQLPVTPAFRESVIEFIPGPYNWWLFFAGEIFVLTALWLFYRRYR